MENFWSDKRVLITGACGTVACQLIKHLIEMKPLEIVGIDNNESDLFFIMEEYRHIDNLRFFLGDIRDLPMVMRHMEGIDIVLHTAAYKHVILCERSPAEAISTNVNGVQNIIEAAIKNHVQRVVFTSSDKAVNPTNVMGTSKLMGERLMTAANSQKRNSGPIFLSTRFGNVLGSSGSVIPLFRKQIASGGPVTLTDEGMTRFIMTLEESSLHVLKTVELGRGGEVFVTKMAVIRIADLAHAMISELAEKLDQDPDDIKIEVIGAKPGEKMYEELMNEEEIRRAVDLGDYFAVTPAFRSEYSNIDYDYGINPKQVTKPYNSAVEEAMSLPDLRQYLVDHKLI